MNVQADSDSLSPGRLEALSDGVIAIAITLLVLELSIPILGGGGGDGDAPSSLADMGGEFYAYAMGFLALGIYWSLHHYIFHFIRRSDGVLMWLNVMFLSFASMVPFWTAFQVENGERPESVAYYGVAMIATFLTLLAIWVYVTWDNRLVGDGLPRSVVRRMITVIAIGSIMVLVFSFGNMALPGMGFLLFVPAAWFIYWSAWGHRHFEIDAPPNFRA